MVDKVNDDFSEGQFIKIKEAEVKKKFSELAIQKGNLKIWKSGEEKALNTILEAMEDSGEEGPIKVLLSLKKKVEGGVLKGQEVFIYFSIKKSKFFCLSRYVFQSTLTSSTSISRFSFHIA